MHTFILVDCQPGWNEQTKTFERSHVDRVNGKPGGGSKAKIFKPDHYQLDTYVHEFGHMLGLPDLYYEEVGQDFTTGQWIVKTHPYKRYEKQNLIMAEGGTEVSGEELAYLYGLNPGSYNKGLPLSWEDDR